MKHSFTNEAQQARQTFLVWLSAFFCLLASLCLPLSAAPVINNNAGTDTTGDWLVVTYVKAAGG